jgi:hypothetical protein
MMYGLLLFALLFGWSSWAHAQVIIQDGNVTLGQATTIQCVSGIECGLLGSTGTLTVTGGTGGGAPTDASYVTLGTNSVLTNERVLTSGTGIGITDGGAGLPVTIANTGVLSITGTANQIARDIATGAVTLSFPAAVIMPGSLTVTTRTGTPDKFVAFDTTGKLVAGATYVTPGTGTLTNLATTLPITGGPITTTGTIGINVFGASGGSHAIGAVPDPGAVLGTTKFLREDATWATPAGGGSGTVTNIATTSPIAGGPITSTGTLTCPTCVTSAAALTANQLILGGSGQAVSTIGSLGTTSTVLHGNAAGAPSFGPIVSADLNITATTCTNQFIRNLSSSAAGTCATVANTDLANSSITLNGTAVSLGGTRTLTLASSDFVNQGTTSTVLHGNAAGNPSFGKIVSADLNITATTCTNQFIRNLSTAAAGTCASVANADLANSATTVNGQTCTLGGTCTVPAVTNIATTAPITGGPITTTGTIGITDFVASGTSHARGAVPDPGLTAGTTKFLREDATWQVPPSTSGAPIGAQYWTGAADATLSAEQNLGALATGLVLNTAGTPSTYAGTSCANQFPRSLNASGAATCASVANADLVNTATTVNGVTCTLGSPCTVPVGVTSFSAGNLSPLFTTSVATAGTTPALSFTQATVLGNTIFANSGATTAVPTFTTMDLLLDRSYGTLRGNMLYRGDLGWASLPASTATTVLHSSATAGPSWGPVANADLVNASISIGGNVVALGSNLQLRMPPPCGRLTLTSGVPVTTTAVTSGTVYYTPDGCDTIVLWNGSTWLLVSFTEKSLSLAGLPGNTNYDVFGYVSGGTLALELTVWTNLTTRASAITNSAGLWVKASNPTRLLLGTISTVGTGTTEDSPGTSSSQFGGNRLVSNVYNRVSRRNGVYDTTSFWSYTSSAWRIANGATSPNNCIQWVSALSDQGFSASVRASVQLANNTGSNYAYVGVGLDGAGPSLWQAGAQNTLNSYVAWPIIAISEGYAGAGRHVVCWLEAGADSTSTFLGQYAATVSGMTLLVEN